MALPRMLMFLVVISAHVLVPVLNPVVISASVPSHVVPDKRSFLKAARERTDGHRAPLPSGGNSMTCTSNLCVDEV